MSNIRPDLLPDPSVDPEAKEWLEHFKQMRPTELLWAWDTLLARAVGIHIPHYSKKDYIGKNHEVYNFQVGTGMTQFSKMLFPIGDLMLHSDEPNVLMNIGASNQTLGVPGMLFTALKPIKKGHDLRLSYYQVKKTSSDTSLTAKDREYNAETDNDE